MTLAHLPDDELVQEFVDFLRRRRRLPIRSGDSGLGRPEFRFRPSGRRLFRVVFRQDDEEMGALVALDEPGRGDELVDVFARGAALRADLQE